MAGKKGHKKGKKSGKKIVKNFEKAAAKIVHGNKRPLSFLKEMREKMGKNIVKLDKLIANPGNRPK
jgi:hypothetical protein